MHENKIKIRFSRKPSLGTKIEHKLFFLNFLGAPGISLAKAGISRQKVWFPWVLKDIPNFSAPPLHVEDPHPTRRYPDQKVWVWVPFSSLIFDQNLFRKILPWL